MRERSTLHNTSNKRTAGQGGPGGQGTGSGEGDTVSHNTMSKEHIEKVKICQAVGDDEEVSYVFRAGKVSPAEGRRIQGPQRQMEEEKKRRQAFSKMFSGSNYFLQILVEQLRLGHS